MTIMKTELNSFIYTLISKGISIFQKSLFLLANLFSSNQIHSSSQGTNRIIQIFSGPHFYFGGLQISILLLLEGNILGICVYHSGPQSCVTIPIIPRCAIRSNWAIVQIHKRENRLH